MVRGQGMGRFVRRSVFDLGVDDVSARECWRDSAWFGDVSF
jgi:hypothetical protein